MDRCVAGRSCSTFSRYCLLDSVLIRSATATCICRVYSKKGNSITVKSDLIHQALTGIARQQQYDFASHSTDFISDHRRVLMVLSVRRRTHIAEMNESQSWRGGIASILQYIVVIRTSTVIATTIVTRHWETSRFFVGNYK